MRVRESECARERDEDKERESQSILIGGRVSFFFDDDGDARSLTFLAHFFTFTSSLSFLQVPFLRYASLSPSKNGEPAFFFLSLSLSDDADARARAPLPVEAEHKKSRGVCRVED